MAIRGAAKVSGDGEQECGAAGMFVVEATRSGRAIYGHFMCVLADCVLHFCFRGHRRPGAL